MLVSCTQMIKDDFLPDLEGCRQVERDERMRLSGALDTAREKIQDLRDAFSNHSKAILEYDRQLKSQVEYSKRLEEENEDLRRQLAKHHKLINLLKELEDK